MNGRLGWKEVTGAELVTSRNARGVGAEQDTAQLGLVDIEHGGSTLWLTRAGGAGNKSREMSI